MSRCEACWRSCPEKSVDAEAVGRARKQMLLYSSAVLSQHESARFAFNLRCLHSCAAMAIKLPKSTTTATERRPASPQEHGQPASQLEALSAGFSTGCTPNHTRCWLSPGSPHGCKATPAAWGLFLTEQLGPVSDGTREAVAQTRAACRVVKPLAHSDVPDSLGPTVPTAPAAPHRRSQRCCGRRRCQRSTGEVPAWLRVPRL